MKIMGKLSAVLGAILDLDQYKFNSKYVKYPPIYRGEFQNHFLAGLKVYG